MLSVTLPQASAGAALFGRAVLGPLDDASVPPSGTFPGRLRVPMSTMRQWGICSGGVAIFCVARTAMVPGATAPHLREKPARTGRGLRLNEQARTEASVALRTSSGSLAARSLPHLPHSIIRQL